MLHPQFNLGDSLSQIAGEHRGDSRRRITEPVHALDDIVDIAGTDIKPLTDKILADLRNPVIEEHCGFKGAIILLHAVKRDAEPEFILMLHGELVDNRNLVLFHVKGVHIGRLAEKLQKTDIRKNRAARGVTRKFL